VSLRRILAFIQKRGQIAGANFPSSLGQLRVVENLIDALRNPAWV
jgi:hypothetical protein